MHENYGLNNFSSGLIAGFACTTVVTPIDRIKIEMQLKKDFTNSQLKNIKNIFMEQGLRSFYRGWSATLFREIPGFGFYFSSYNYLYNKKIENFGKPPSKMEVALYGGLSGVYSWIFILPPDIIKTHMQSSNNYKNIIDCIKTLYLKGGIFQFYKGFAMTMMRAFPLHSGVFLGYEICNQIL